VKINITYLYRSHECYSLISYIFNNHTTSLTTRLNFPQNATSFRLIIFMQHKATALLKTMGPCGIFATVSL